MSDPTPRQIIGYISQHVRCPRCNSADCSVDWPLVIVIQDADGSPIATNEADCRLCGWRGLLDAMDETP